QHVAGIGLETRAAEIEHRPLFLVDDLDAQAQRGVVDQDLVLQLAEYRIDFFQFFLQLLFQGFQAFLFELFIFAFDLVGRRLGFGLWHRLQLEIDRTVGAGFLALVLHVFAAGFGGRDRWRRGRAFLRQRVVHLDHAGVGATGADQRAARIVEVAGDGLLLRGGGGRQ